LFAVILYFIFWSSISEDSWPDPGYPYEEPWNAGYALNGTPQAPGTTGITYEPIRIEQPIGMSLESTLSELSIYETSFLNLIESEVRKLVGSFGRRECTAIVAKKPSGYTVTYRVTSDPADWTRRFVAMIKHKDSTSHSLPNYKGEELDSYLSEHIISKVSDLHSQFLFTHGDIIGKHMVDRLRMSNEVQRTFARQFAHSVREVGMPLTDGLYAALVNLIQHQLSTHATNHLGVQLGQALTYAGGQSAITGFSATISRVFDGAITKVMVKSVSGATLKSVFIKFGTKILVKTIVGSLVTFISAHLLAHSGAALGAFPVLLFVLPIIIAWSALEIAGFPEELADKIAPNVRDAMAREFDSRNRSALEMIFQDIFADSGRQICKTLLSDPDLAGKAKAAAEEMLRASNTEGYDATSP
jgi:hypothetical protein